MIPCPSRRLAEVLEADRCGSSPSMSPSITETSHDLRMRIGGEGMLPSEFLKGEHAHGLNKSDNLCILAVYCASCAYL